MVRQWQTLFYGQRYSNTILNDQEDFVKLAEAMGAVGIRVTKKEEVGAAIEKAIPYLPFPDDFLQFLFRQICLIKYFFICRSCRNHREYFIITVNLTVDDNRNKI